jgi:glycosyltransferase involved in cell wall biosynthesis
MEKLKIHDKNDDPPRISIGLPVYNGEKYLEESLKSILAQTFTDFELIISDNASTDRTKEICRAFAAKDQRIRYIRNQTNIGGARNHNQTFRLSRGKYFRWAAHDDICEPELLAKCVEVLENNPTAVLSYPAVVSIDENGNKLRTTFLGRAQSVRPHERFRTLAFRNHSCEATYGLIRSDVLRQTRLVLDYTDSDRTLLCELGLRGRFIEIPELLFYKRYHAGNVYLDWRDRMAWFDPRLKGEIVFPNWTHLLDLHTTVNRVSLPRGEKLWCYATIAQWAFRYGPQLAKDIFVGLYESIHSREWRLRNASPDNWE